MKTSILLAQTISLRLPEVAIVTGNSSGIGFETSLTLARNGFYTYATVRKLKEGSKQITDIAK
jgi:NAD(P)-dependent dehydrogenase (short-subunit alcohol dehydrogenase family)